MVRNKNEPQKGLNSGSNNTNSNIPGKQILNGKLSTSETSSPSKSKEQKQSVFFKSGSFMKIGPKMSAKDLSVRVNTTPYNKNTSAQSTSAPPLTAQINGFDKDHFDNQVNGNINSSDNENASGLSTLPHSSQESCIKEAIIKTEASNQNLHVSRWKSQAFIYKRMFGVYKEGQNVLTRWSDGLYYLGKICKVTTV